MIIEELDIDYVYNICTRRVLKHKKLRLRYQFTMSLCSSDPRAFEISAK